MKMTASLLQACDYYFQTGSQRAMQQLHETLTTGFVGNAATRRGEAYESYVNKILAEDGKFNLAIQTKFGEFVFKGRTDYRHPDNLMVYDLKTTKYFNAESYHNKWQHTIYAHAMGAPAFKYIVAVFQDSDGLNPASINKVIPTVQPLATLKDKVEECVDFLSKNFLEDFEHWTGGKVLGLSGF